MQLSEVHLKTFISIYRLLMNTNIKLVLRHLHFKIHSTRLYFSFWLNKPNSKINCRSICIRLWNGAGSNVGNEGNRSRGRRARCRIPPTLINKFRSTARTNYSMVGIARRVDTASDHIWIYQQAPHLSSS